MKSTNIKKRNQFKVKSSDTISIALKKKTSSPYIDSTDLNIQSVARQLKERLSNATKHVSITTNKTSSSILKPAPKRTSSLRNMRLLKNYLTFVSQEIKDVQLGQNNIKFSIASTEPSQDCASLGATLIESIVHNTSSVMEKHLSHKQEDRSGRIVRRPGRPPKSQNVNNDIDLMEEKRKKKDLIQCICDAPNEEFGSMVQCDDCYRWLHLDCLELSQEALEDTFRCPCCFLSLGVCDKNAKRLSSITWRYAAQWKSQRLAALGHHELTDDEDDEEDFPMDISVEENTPETPTDWPDVSSDSCSSQESEVNTPNEYLSNQDPFDKLKQQIILDPESLEILSRIAYLQSLDSVRKEIFAPNASDVFLCENLSNHNSGVPMMNFQAPRFAANVPPSDICSQDLSEYSFDSGPFWEPLL